MNSDKSKKILRNSLFMYLRMIFSLGISLYTSRIILQILGVEDYGIYNVVGGFVTMFTFLSGSLTSATQRFITFELGNTKSNRSRDVFSSSLIIHILLGIIIFLILETIGLWFLNTRLNISASRLLAANWVFQSSIIIFSTKLFCIPYQASVIAHEKIDTFAFVGILEVILKLAAVIILQFIITDKLVTYSLLIMIIAFVVNSIYIIYSRINFSECRFQIVKDRNIYKAMTKFAGWNFLGASSQILMKQGVNILINLFFGVLLNAARGIAGQIDNVLNQFVNSLMIAINPQITKSFAAKDYRYTMILVQNGSKISFFLMYLLSYPIILETETLLSLWLGSVPKFTVIFLRLTIIITLISTLSNTLVTLLLATGRIKKYQIIVGGLGLLVLPVSYLFLKLGYSPEITYIIIIFIFVLQLIARLILLNSYIWFSIIEYSKSVFFRIILVVLFSFFPPLIINNLFNPSLMRLILVSSCSIIINLIVIYLLGFNSQEKGKIKLYIKKRISNRKGNVYVQ